VLSQAPQQRAASVFLTLLPPLVPKARALCELRPALCFYHLSRIHGVEYSLLKSLTVRCVPQRRPVVAKSPLSLCTTRAFAWLCASLYYRTCKSDSLFLVANCQDLAELASAPSLKSSISFSIDVPQDESPYSGYGQYV
jgi:hypothetical protein